MSLNVKVSTKDRTQSTLLNLFLIIASHMPFTEVKDHIAIHSSTFLPPLLLFCVLIPLWLKCPPIKILCLISPHPFKPNPVVSPALESQASQTNSNVFFL